MTYAHLTIFKQQKSHHLFITMIDNFIDYEYIGIFFL